MTMKLYCPVQFDPQIHLAPDTLRFADHLVYLAHLVYYRKHTDRRYSHHGPVPIKAAYVREIVGKNLYPRVIRLAQEIGLIEITGKAVEGKSCRLWDIGEQFKGEYQKREITNWLLIRRIRAARREHRQEVGSKGRWLRRKMVYDFLFGWAEQLEITIPREQTRFMAESICYVYEDELKEKHSQKVKENLRKPKVERRNIGEFNVRNCIDAAIMQIEAVQDREWIREVDERGRMYTNLTSMWGRLRRYIRFDGQHLTGFDVKSSQMVFLGLYAWEKLSYGSTGYTPNTSTNLHTNPPTNSHTNPSGTPLPNYGNNDINLFLQVACDPKVNLYTYLGQRAGFDLPPDQAKTRTFGVIYGRNRFPSKMLRVIQSEFPSVAHVIREAKRPLNDEDKKSHARLPMEMQRVEADFMIGTVCRRWMNELPHLPLFCIHDSLLTVKGHEHHIQRIMDEEFEKLGIRPFLKPVSYE